MLEHLSPKFKLPPMEREPRAALILNRFTRNLTVMFATASITSVLGLRPNEIKNKGFYRCIQENCLSEAIECLESAKANDSIAYLRFFFQDPREDEELADAPTSSNMVGGGDHDMPDAQDLERPRHEDIPVNTLRDTSRMGESSLIGIKIEEDDTQVSMPAVPLATPATSSASSSRLPSIELEAVVSCTSDGLVVILRKARPPIPPAHPPLIGLDYRDGLFAAPWAQQPIRPHFPHESLYTFRPPLLPQYMPLRDNVKDAGGPPLDVLMGSIREVAVFAWGVVGINPKMAAYGRGLPSGEARPSSKFMGNYEQLSCRGDDGGNASGATLATIQNKGKAPETIPLANRRQDYATRRPRSHASYNALDPVAGGGGTSNGSCGFQSAAWTDSASSSSWGLSQSNSETTHTLRSSTSHDQQASMNIHLYSTSNAPLLRMPPSAGGAACQAPAYSTSPSQSIPPSSSSSAQDHRYLWR